MIEILNPDLTPFDILITDFQAGEESTPIPGPLCQFHKACFDHLADLTRAYFPLRSLPSGPICIQSTALGTTKNYKTPFATFPCVQNRRGTNFALFTEEPCGLQRGVHAKEGDRMKVKASAILAILFLPSSLASAGTTGWSYSNYDYGSYVPLRGTFEEYVDSYYHEYVNYVTFSFDSTNVNSILNYNNGGDNPGTACDGYQAYLTVDTKAVPAYSYEYENLNALRNYSNLPNPKFDIEDDFGTGPQYEESEVVALGTVQAGVEYYFDTFWEDLRGGFPQYNGDIIVQFAMSSAGYSDYNNCTQSSVNQVVNPYSQYRHSL